MSKKSELLIMFENYKGFKSNLFDNEDWREMDAFVAGYKIAESKKQ